MAPPSWGSAQILQIRQAHTMELLCGDSLDIFYTTKSSWESIKGKEANAITIHIFDASHRGAEWDGNASVTFATVPPAWSQGHSFSPPCGTVRCGLPAPFCCIAALRCHSLEGFQSAHHVEMSKIITDGLQLPASKPRANSQQQCENRKGRMSLFW